MDNRIALFRDSMEPIGFVTISEYQLEWRIPYAEPMNMRYFQDDPNLLDPSRMTKMWIEVFRPVGGRCPCCKIVPYASTNYKEAPPWVKFRNV